MIYYSNYQYLYLIQSLMNLPVYLGNNYYVLHTNT